jgi:hypothetical protein
MWNLEDKVGFQNALNSNTGQININQKFGKIIYNLAILSENKIFVDIGTWNGLGSTKCFIEAMKTNFQSTLYTIENNTEKYEIAKSFWLPTINEFKLNVNFINGSLIENHHIDQWLSEEQIELDVNQKYWLSIDKTNSTQLIDLRLGFIDILLIDGSEFSGFLEMIKFSQISKYILLDDVNSIKNKKSREFLLKDDNFDLLEEDLNDRNGFSVFKKK